MKHTRDPTGFTIVELLAVVLAVTLLLAAILPSIARAQSTSGVQQSMSNLATLGVSHVLYALDWDGRQVTWVKDDLGVYGGNVWEYNVAHGCSTSHPTDPECQRGVVAGRGCTGPTWGYWGSSPFIQPLIIVGGPGPDGSAGWGGFRIASAKSFHDYVNGRYHDPVFYAPDDATVLERVAECIDEPCEFVADPDSGDFESCNPGWPSYALSPAAMFHPDVWRSNADGGWQAPWELDHGYESLGLFQASYPNLKTHMIEHSWLQDPPADCNPAWPGCEPYWFNHGIDSTPVTLFYDGSVRLLPNTEVFAADQQVLQQTGGVDGLWHRGTPFGEDGYFIPEGYDGTPLSHHILTTDGILGRDTLGGAQPPPRPPLRASRRSHAGLQAAAAPKHIIDWQSFMFTPHAGDQP